MSNQIYILLAMRFAWPRIAASFPSHQSVHLNNEIAINLLNDQLIFQHTIKLGLNAVNTDNVVSVTSEQSGTIS